MTRRGGRIAWLILAALFVLLVLDLWFIRWAWFRDLISITDEALYVQVAHNTLHGSFLRTTLAPEVPTSAGLSLFGIHFIPSFLLMMIPYALIPHALTFSFVQIVLLISGIFPAFALTQKKTRSTELGVAVAVAYASHMAILGNAISHYPPTQAISVLLWAMWAYESGRRGWFIAGMVLYAGFVESLAICMAGVAAVLFLQKRERLGLILALVGGLWFLLSAKVIIPSFSHGSVDQLGKVFIPGESLGAWFAHFARPDLWLRLACFLLPFLFLPLLSPLSCLPAVPIIIVLFVMGNGFLFHGAGSRYIAPTVSIFLLAMIDGLGRIKSARTKQTIAGALLIAAIGQHFLASLDADFGEFLRLQKSAWARWRSPANAAVAAFRQEGLSVIPPHATVAASHRLALYVAAREKLFLFPRFWQEADYLVIDRRNPLYFPFESPQEFQKTLEEIRQSELFEPIHTSNSFVILKKVPLTSASDSASPR